MIDFQICTPIADTPLRALFDSAWAVPFPEGYTKCLSDTTLWVSAYDGSRLVGFVKVVTDGGQHGFVLDTTTHPDYQRQGVGRGLLSHAATASRQRGVRWLHADFLPEHQSFYRGAGFRPTAAGLLDLHASD